MSDVSVLVTKDSIHLNFDGQYQVVNSSHKNYNEIRNYIKSNTKELIPALFVKKVPLPINDYIENTGLVLVNDRLQDREGNVLPEVLSERLVAMNEEGFPVTPLVSFWNNLKTNPSEVSRNALYKFLEQNGHPLTEDGCFVAYRGVRSDFKDKHSGTFDNSVGSVCEMPREDVDDDPNQTCSRGLHVAAFEYARGFSQVTVEVKVNPRDVVAVPNDYNGQKMRVCRFEVVAVCSAPNTDVVYGNQTQSWDFDENAGYEDDGEAEDRKEHAAFVKEEVLDLARNFKVRYTDRLMLAARIDEAMNDDGIWDYDGDPVSVTEILDVLNSNTSDWESNASEDDNDNDEDEDEDEGSSDGQYGWGWN